jgi:hypothetical protein
VLDAPAVPPEAPTAPIQPERKINVEFTEKELTLLEDILNGVHPDNNEEKDLLFSISHKLRDNLIKSK